MRGQREGKETPQHHFIALSRPFRSPIQARAGPLAAGVKLLHDIRGVSRGAEGCRGARGREWPVGAASRLQFLSHLVTGRNTGHSKENCYRFVLFCLEG